MESIPNNNNMLETEVAVLLNYLSDFWRSLDFHLINCEIELHFSWSRYYLIPE